ncbi:hypothetical protein ACH4D3_09570 [Streptomyces sp. NPDC018026]|uniref:hypothetical protein n=1 Tax=Streptomyces sp. NPDC018026 TaxID=3365031 RepID=UPI00379F10FB
MGGKRGTTVALAVAAAMVLGLLVAFWRLARTENVDLAVMAGGAAFVAAFGMAFAVLTYVRGG